MKTRRRNYSEDHNLSVRASVNRLNKRAKTSENGGENALPISIDLVFEIFSRLPMKSIARCRCVSKIWASMLNRREFTELFQKKSSASPQLLFACKKGKELLIFSSPQPQNPDENSSPLVASHHMSFSFDGAYEISGVVDGLICVTISDGRKETVPVICNTITGESLPLKKVKTSRVTARRIMFGYDPIDKGFKFLSMTWPLSGRCPSVQEHHVLTLGTDNWRLVESCIPHSHSHRYIKKELCINGVLYYLYYRMSVGTNAIYCFDVRSEKFSLIEVNEPTRYSTLINYGGNLGLLWSQTGDGRFHRYFDQRNTSLTLWVLEDVERQEWSKCNLMLPPLWKDVVGERTLSVVGITGKNEIVFKSLSPSMYLFYLNTDKNTIVRVEIQGSAWNKYAEIDIFMNHVEDVKLV